MSEAMKTSKSAARKSGAPRPDQNPEAMKRLRRIARQYHGRSNWQGFRVVAYDWGIIFAVAIICEWLRGEVSLWAFLPLYLLGCLMIGSRFRGMENLVHEASHYNLFSTRTLNDWMEFAFALPVFRTVADFRRSHLIHHASLGHRDVDPDLDRYRSLGLTELPKNFWWIVVIRPLTGYLTLHYVWYDMLRFWRSKTSRPSKIIFWAAVLAIITLLGIWEQALLYWISPFFIILPAPRFWSVMSEHGGLDLTHDVASSRNNLGAAIQQWFIYPHNDGYHETHHLYPSIPWYLIHRANRQLMDDPYFATYCQESHSLYATAEHMAHNAIITFEDKAEELRALGLRPEDAPKLQEWANSLGAGESLIST